MLLLLLLLWTCAFASEKCGRVSYNDYGDIVTGTLYGHFIDFDCSDSIKELYCTDDQLSIFLSVLYLTLISYNLFNPFAFICS